ncbi:MAG: transcriptional regulator [Candidatus Micrarchaeota archaeon]
MSEGRKAQATATDFLGVLDKAKGLNSKVFSLTRLELLSQLARIFPESVTFRELKAVLGLTDGALYANLKALQEMGYARSETVSVSGKELEAYCITREGLEEWTRVKDWLREFASV